MAKSIELRRHTDNEDDELSRDGIDAALEIGARLGGGYELLVSSGAQRATQTLACIACRMSEPVPGGVVVEPGFRSSHEDRWREAYQEAGSGELEAMRSADPDFVEQDSRALAESLERILDRLDEGGRALAIGHSPTTEAAIYGLTGELIDSISKGEGVVLVVEGGEYRVEDLG